MLKAIRNLAQPLEEGPIGEYVLSFYGLNETVHKQWKEWQGNGSLVGFICHQSQSG